MRIVFFGLSITSSWGNGHATNYRALVRALAARGHDVVFFERDVPWYAASRDLPSPPWGTTVLYGSLPELQRLAADDVAGAGLVVVGSYVPEGAALIDWVLEAAGGVVAFWDIDTPVTVEKLARGEDEYLRRDQVQRFDLYLSFTAGPLLDRIESELGAARTAPFLCMADPDVYRPLPEAKRWLLGYLGTYSADRQPGLERLLLEPARRRPRDRFVVAGPQYPELDWPDMVERIDHVAPAEHAAFYARQRFTLNVTRAAMTEAGWSPSVRLFEAAACGCAIVSDRWSGLEAFFVDGRELLVVDSTADVLDVLASLTPEDAAALGAAARARVLAAHTPAHRAAELEEHVRSLARQPA